MILHTCLLYKSYGQFASDITTKTRFLNYVKTKTNKNKQQNKWLMFKKKHESLQKPLNESKKNYCSVINY